MNRILCSWIGGTDWDVYDGQSKKDGLGPILRTLSDSEWADVDEIHLLNNYDKRKGSDYKKFLSRKIKSKIVCKDVRLTSPTNFREVDEATTILVRSLPKDSELTFLCSPGTYVMSSIWILLSHNQFPATLIESSKEAGVKRIDVPFDISVRDLIDRADQARIKISSGRRPYSPDFEVIQHDCAPMRNAIHRASLIASRGINILIEGETGTGRQLLARCIHKKSRRKQFLSINCSAHTENDLEHQLFGTERVDGAYGETRRTRGLLRKHADSTLYIEEVDSLAPFLQTRLLQELSHDDMKDGLKKRPRLIFSTARPIAESVSKGHFRRDLLYRIMEDTIFLPALRDRGIKDLELITDALLVRLKKELKSEGAGIDQKHLDRKARRALEVFPFEGNVRELESVLVRALVHSTRETLGTSDIESALTTNYAGHTADNVLNRSLDESFVLDDVLDEVTRHYLARAKNSTPSLRQAATALGFKNYQTLANRIKKLEGFDW